MTCPFCSLDPAEIVLSGERCLVIETRDPVLVGSVMIVPREHRETVFDLTPDEWSETYRLIQQARARLAQLPASVQGQAAWREELAQLHNNRGNLLCDLGQLPEALGSPA